AVAMIGGDPVVGVGVALAVHRSCGVPSGGRCHPDPLQRPLDGTVRIGREIVLVADGQGLDGVAAEEASPAALLTLEAPYEMVDGVEPVLRGGWGGAVLTVAVRGAPTARLQRLPHAHRLPDDVAAGDPDVAGMEEQAIQEHLDP